MATKTKVNAGGMKANNKESVLSAKSKVTAKVKNKVNAIEPNHNQTTRQA